MFGGPFGTVAASAPVVAYNSMFGVPATSLPHPSSNAYDMEYGFGFSQPAPAFPPQTGFSFNTAPPLPLPQLSVVVTAAAPAVQPTTGRAYRREQCKYTAPLDTHSIGALPFGGTATFGDTDIQAHLQALELEMSTINQSNTYAPHTFGGTDTTCTAQYTAATPATPAPAPDTWLSDAAACDTHKGDDSDTDVDEERDDVGTANLRFARAALDFSGMTALCEVEDRRVQERHRKLEQDRLAAAASATATAAATGSTTQIVLDSDGIMDLEDFEMYKGHMHPTMYPGTMPPMPVYEYQDDITTTIY